MHGSILLVLTLVFAAESSDLSNSVIHENGVSLSDFTSRLVDVETEQTSFCSRPHDISPLFFRHVSMPVIVRQSSPENMVVPPSLFGVFR